MAGEGEARGDLIREAQFDRANLDDLTTAGGHQGPPSSWGSLLSNEQTLRLEDGVEKEDLRCLGQ